MVASVGALAYYFPRGNSFGCVKIVQLLLIILMVTSINSILAKISRWSFTGLMDPLSYCWRNSIVICGVYLSRSNLMLIVLLRRRYLVSSTLCGLSTIWTSLVSLFFWEDVVDLVYPSRRYGVEIVTLTSWCLVEFVWVFLCVFGCLLTVELEYSSRGSVLED